MGGPALTCRNSNAALDFSSLPPALAAAIIACVARARLPAINMVQPATTISKAQKVSAKAAGDEMIATPYHTAGAARQRDNEEHYTGGERQ